MKRWYPLTHPRNTRRSPLSIVRRRNIFKYSCPFQQPEQAGLYCYELYFNCSLTDNHHNVVPSFDMRKRETKRFSHKASQTISANRFPQFARGDNAQPCCARISPCSIIYNKIFVMNLGALFSGALIIATCPYMVIPATSSW